LYPGQIRSIIPLFLVAVALAGTLVTAQQQQPTFRSGARTVAVYATVSDEQGRLVPDLTRDEFEILDNGKPQTITVFDSETQPITIVVMLDRSESMRRNFTLVEAAAEEFVHQLMAGDKARIGSFATRIQLDPVDFTGDKPEMLGILRTELQPAGPTPLWNAVNVGMTALLHQEKRRVVLVFTDGVDAPGNLRSNNVTLKEATKRAEEENVMVYAIGLAGQNGFRGGGMPPGHHGGFGGGGGRWSGGGPPGGSKMEKPDEGLAKIASATGGGYFELTDTNDLGSTFRRVAEELHRQYALGFEPEKLDGKAHKLEVRVKRPGMTTRARKSYVASREWQ
jgi:Ca-activated chloride channel family protein